MQRKWSGFIVRLLTGVLVLAVAGLPARSASAATVIRYAKVNGKTTGTCGKWSTACKLQYAIQMAAAATNSTTSAQVWVQKGTYRPTLLSDPTQEFDRTQTFQLYNKVAIYGGFAGSETSVKARKPVKNVTILSGEIHTPALDDNSYHVVTASGTNNTAILDGFTITAGYANGDPIVEHSYPYGGGIYNVSGTPILRNLIITANNARNIGGGMYNQGAGPALAISTVTFSNNSILDTPSAQQGGGMYNLSSSPTLTDVTFSGNNGANEGGGMLNSNASNPALTRVTFTNNSAKTGGGMSNEDSSPTLTDVVFAGNSSTNTSDGGGGMYNNKTGGTTQPHLTNVTFSGNTAVNGGGMYNNAGSEPELTNVTFSSNTASGTGGGMANQSSDPVLVNVTFKGNSAAGAGSGDGIYNANSSPVITNTILWDDGSEEVYNADAGALPVFTNSVVEGSCPAGSGSCTNLVSTNPVLGTLGAYGAKTTGTKAFTQVIPLGAGSSAIDQGNALDCPATDQRGLARPADACDIGAFEVRSLTFVSAGSYDGQVQETAAGSGLGGAVNATAATFQVGDDALNRQWRGFLSFNSGTVPDSATVVFAKIKMKPNGALTGDPFGTLSTLYFDLRRPYIGTSAGLLATDYNAAITTTGTVQAGTVNATPVNGWYVGAVTNGLANVSKTGTTQFRLYFSGASANDTADYVLLYSGNAATSANRPTLTVYFNP